MRKIVFAIVIAFCGTLSMKAQDISYGATVGYNNLVVTASFQGVSSSAGESGIYFGVFADFKVTSEFHIQPEVQYGAIFANGDSGNELLVPIVAKYYVSDKLSVQAGPQFDLILDESPGLKKLGLGLAAGLGFDITEKVSARARYSFGLTNRLDDDINLLDDFGDIMIDDISTKFNFFQIGVGYTF